MTDYCFKKVNLGFDGYVIIVFEQGNFGKPVCILNRNDIDELNEEWKMEWVKK